MRFNVWNKFASIFLVIGLLGTSRPTSVSALDQKNQTTGSVVSADMVLRDLGLDTNRLLQGPLDETSVVFSLPADWAPAADAMLALDVNVHFGSLMPTSEKTVLPADVIIGELEIVFNGNVIHKELLKTPGKYTFTVTVNQKDLIAGMQSGVNQLTVRWNALSSCSFQIATSIEILPTSKLTLQYLPVSVVPNLALFPKPFYLENSPQPVAVTVAVPDKASQAELQAGLAITAYFGKVSKGKIAFDLVTFSQLYGQDNTNSHFIIVGKTSALAGSPFENASNGIAATASADEGIIVEMVSPWNPSRLALLVGGSNDAAAARAGQALSSGRLITAAGGTVAVVKSFEPATAAINPPIDVSLASLGQKGVTVSRFGENQVSIPFSVPAGTTIDPQAYFDLMFAHSQMLDYLQSSLRVMLNDMPIGSVRFSDQTTVSTAARFIIPVSALQPLDNQLVIEINITPGNMCADPRLGDNWVTIYSDSSLHLPPLEHATALVPQFDLGQYPRPFIYDASLKSTTFILNADDPPSWKTAAALALDLGSHTAGSYFIPSVLFATSSADIAKAAKNLLVIGLTNKISAAPQINTALPVPFNADGGFQDPSRVGSDFRIGADQPVGYLEVSNIPADPQHAMLAVLGNSQQGIAVAAQALLDTSAAKRSLVGNFAVVQGGTVIPSTVNAAASAPSPAPGAKGVQRPSTAGELRQEIVIGLTVAAILAILLVAFTLIKKPQKPT